MLKQGDDGIARNAFQDASVQHWRYNFTVDFEEDVHASDFFDVFFSIPSSQST